MKLQRNLGVMEPDRLNAAEFAKTKAEADYDILIKASDCIEKDLNIIQAKNAEIGCNPLNLIIEKDLSLEYESCSLYLCVLFYFYTGRITELDFDLRIIEQSIVIEKEKNADSFSKFGSETYEILKQDNTTLRTKLDIARNVINNLKFTISEISTIVTELESHEFMNILLGYDDCEAMRSFTEKCIDEQRTSHKHSLQHHKRFLSENTKKIEKRKEIFTNTLNKDSYHSLIISEILNFDNMLEHEIQEFQMDCTKMSDAFTKLEHEANIQGLTIGTLVENKLIIANSKDEEIKELKEIAKKMLDNNNANKSREAIQKYEAVTQELLKDIELLKQLIAEEHNKAQLLMENAVKYFDGSGLFQYENCLEQYQELKSKCNICKNVDIKLSVNESFVNSN